MATIRDLKKIINYEFSGVIEECYLWQLSNSEKAEKAEKIIDEAIKSFDSLIERINNRPDAGLKAHFNAISKDMYKSTNSLTKKLAKL